MRGDVPAALITRPLLGQIPDDQFSLLRRVVVLYRRSQRVGSLAMGTDALVRLHSAIAATRFGGGQRTIATRVRTGGLRAFEQILFALQSDERHQVEGQAGDLSNEGIDAILVGRPDYPEALG